MKILKENQKLREMKKQRKKCQVVLAVILVIFGVIMITVAFIVPPLGVIDPTVLTAFGEILTFAGSLIGIDYHYRYKSLPLIPPRGEESGNEDNED